MTVERAILCADRRVHFAAEYLTNDDPARVRNVADGCSTDPWCGGAPHVIAERERIITDWRAVTS